MLSLPLTSSIEDYNSGSFNLPVVRVLKLGTALAHRDGRQRRVGGGSLHNGSL